MVTDRIDERRSRKRPRDRHRSSRIYYAIGQPPSFLAVWTSRIAIFAAAAAVVTAALHRLSLLQTPVALTIAYLLVAGAALSFVMALVAGLDIWVTGRPGAARVFFGAIVSLGILAVPVGVWAMSLRYPALYDVTTDLAEPPEFTEAKDARGPEANPVDYSADRFASLQRETYPDLKSLIVPRTPDETYELVLQAIKKLKLKSTLEVPPEDEDDSPGFVELSDHTQILGLVDDVVVRVLAEDKNTRVDVRSASRYGSTDFGRNAEHVRAILKEVAARFEASVPDPDKEAAAIKKAKLKAEKDRGRGSKADRKRPNLSRSNIRRAPERKESRPGSAGARGRDKSGAQFDE
jgi:uncharacterized protein (DUF1499 family)